MGIGDIRYTVLQVVNEVFRKLGLDAVSSLSSNKLSIQMVDFINDTCNDLSDFGNWQEVLATANVTAVQGQRDYSIATSANIKNIEDIFVSGRGGPLNFITIDKMRIIARSSIMGSPSQYTIFGTDSNGNPNLRMQPIPSSAEAGNVFSVLYYYRAPLYTTSDASTVIPFPSRIVVLGVLARAILNESGNSPTDHYTLTQQEYLQARKEALNRFNGDTGWDISFTPSLGRRR